MFKYIYIYIYIYTSVVSCGFFRSCGFFGPQDIHAMHFVFVTTADCIIDSLASLQSIGSVEQIFTLSFIGRMRVNK